ncbi:MAG: DUF6326 family protein [Prochloraceae cyanobacterium]|nr:DUF6326 family protein [Prochloraceae cyanobacterium]
MISHKKIVAMDMKAKLSTLWIFFLLNLIFRDIHDLFRPGLLEQMMTGVVNGTQVTDELLLLGGIMVEIPISMVLLSRLLNYRFNRWANIIAGSITLTSIIANKPIDLDDVFFTTIEIIALGAIVWLAWQWRKQEA